MAFQLPGLGLLAQQWGTTDAFCSGKPSVPLAHQAAKGHGVPPPQPFSGHTPHQLQSAAARCFEKRLHLPQTAAAALGVRDRYVMSNANTAAQQVGETYVCKSLPAGFNTKTSHLLITDLITLEYNHVREPCKGTTERGPEPESPCTSLREGKQE